MPTYPLAEGKLEKTGYQRHHGYTAYVPHRLVTVCQRLARHGNGNCQRHRPHIKSQVLCSHYPLMKARHKIPDKPSQEQRHYQQWEHLIYNNHKSRYKRQSRLGMCHWQKQRTQQSHHHIYNNSIRRGSSRVASQLLRHYRTSRCSRADYCQHEPLHHKPCVRIGISPKKQTGKGKQATLRQQKPRMPLMWLQVSRLYLTESHKQHQKQQYRLQHFSHSQHVSLHLVWQWQSPAHQISQSSAYHSHRQSPILQKLNQIHIV